MQKIIKSSPYTNFDFQRTVTNRLLLLSKKDNTEYDKYTDPSNFVSDNDLVQHKPSTVFDPKTNYLERHAYFHSDLKPTFMGKEPQKITSYKYDSKELNKENNMYAFNVNLRIPTIVMMSYLLPDTLLILPSYRPTA